MKWFKHKKKPIEFTPEEILFLKIPKMPLTLEKFTKKFPISSEIDRLYQQYMETKEESIRLQIVGTIEHLEKKYRKVFGGNDWITIEVFPNAKTYYDKLIGTPKEFEIITDHSHYLTRFTQLEERL